MHRWQVLEIGSGWGSMSLLITSTIPGTTVDTLTLSTQQAALARRRAADAGLADRVRVHLMDYRAMPAEWEGAFDRVVSVEMVEAVGREYMEVGICVPMADQTRTDCVWTGFGVVDVLGEDRLGAEQGDGGRCRAAHHHPRSK